MLRLNAKLAKAGLARKLPKIRPGTA